jgi:REP element-mobilizing transposase RayT
MARRPRESSGTGIYHVMIRGINRQNIFDDEEDYTHFISVLYQQVCPTDEITGKPLPSRCIFYAYCLMSNHVHLLIRESSECLASVIKRIAVSYAQYYNKKYIRFGHLFQDRFKSEPVNDMEYFATLLRYIHQNPVAAGIVANVRDYPWTSWCEYQPDMKCILPVCTTKHVLSRLPLTVLTGLVDEMLPKAMNILDFNNEMPVRISDDKVRDFLMLSCGVTNLTALQHYPKTMRNEIIMRTREFGASIRQITRLTGISEGIIRKIK